MIGGASSSLELNNTNEDELEIPMADGDCVTPARGAGNGRSTRVHSRDPANPPPTGSTPLVKPLNSFSCDEKIGREMVLLEHCTSGSSLRMDSSHSVLSASLGGGAQEVVQSEDSDLDLMVSGSEGRRRRRRRRQQKGGGERKFHVKEEEAEEGEDGDQEQVAGSAMEPSVLGRMTRSQAMKLVSDSEMSHGESDPTTSARMTRRRNRQQKSVSPARKQGESHSSGENSRETLNLVEARTGSGGEGDVTVIAESDDNLEEPNETLLRYVSPIAARTRSRVTGATDSSQSEGEMTVSSHTRQCNGKSPKREAVRLKRDGEKGKKQESQKRGSGRSMICDTSHSENESSTAMATDPAPTQSKSGRVTKGKRVERRREEEQSRPADAVSEATEEMSGSVDTATSQEQRQSVENEEKEVMSSPAPVTSSPVPQKRTSAAVVSGAGETLTDWYIRIVGKNLVVVEGIKKYVSLSISHLYNLSLTPSYICSDDRRRIWHSGPITKRLSSRLVATRSGTLYHLQGPVNREGLAKLDIGELAIPFEDGFPDNWLSVVHRYLLKKILSK